MLKFNNRTYSGSHGPLIVGSPENHTRRVKYWDLKGEGEVRGQPGGRTITVDLLMHDTYSQSELIAELGNMDSRIGTNGTLKELGNVTQSFKNCTFEGYEKIPFGNQDGAGPLQDVAGTLRDDNGDVELDGAGNGGWFCMCRLTFRQLEA